MRRAVAVFIRSVCVAEDTVAYFETGDARADLDDLAGVIEAQDAWVLEPREHELAHVGYYPVDWVDGHCALR